MSAGKISSSNPVDQDVKKLPTPLKISQSKVSIKGNAATVTKKVDRQFTETAREVFSQIQVVNLYKKNTKTRLTGQLRRLNPKILFASFVNKEIVPSRKGMKINDLLEDYHLAMHQIGSEHIMAKSKTGGLIDMQFLSAAKFQDKISEIGGTQGVIKVKSALDHTWYENHPNAPQPYLLSQPDLPTLELGNFYVSKAHSSEELKAQLDLEKAVGKVILPGKHKRGYYCVDPDVYRALKDRGLIDARGRFSLATKELRLKTVYALTDPDQQEIPCFKFPVSSGEGLKNALQALDVRSSSWQLKQADGYIYLMRKTGREFETHQIHFQEKPKFEDHSNRGCVLMSRGNSQSYEKSSEEIFSFLLEGCDVMVYNYPGVGLSQGKTDRKSLIASTEAAYDYLKQEKKLEDNKILASGLCFGSIAASWLGKKHPQISLMLQQTPARINVVMKNIWNEACGEKIQSINDQSSRSRYDRLKLAYFQFLNQNRLIHSIIDRIFKNFSVVDVINENRGHKLIGHGLDDTYIDAQQVVILTDTLAETKNADERVELAFNPGAVHGDSWEYSMESQEKVIRFLNDAAISQPLF